MHKGEADALVGRQADHGVLVEQALVDAAQLLHVERGVVDAAAHPLVGRGEMGKLADGGQQVMVVEVRRIQVEHAIGVEQLAVERGNVQRRRPVLVAQDVEERPQAQVEVVEALRRVQGRVGQPAQPRDAVVAGVVVAIALTRDS